jgi:hypothetical protein
VPIVAWDKGTIAVRQPADDESAWTVIEEAFLLPAMMDAEEVVVLFQALTSKTTPDPRNDPSAKWSMFWFVWEATDLTFMGRAPVLRADDGEWVMEQRPEFTTPSDATKQQEEIAHATALLLVSRILYATGNAEEIQRVAVGLTLKGHDLVVALPMAEGDDLP